MIRFDGFAWRFEGSQAWALQDVSLHIRPGEFAVIVGPSGSGKTTLALAMCGLLIGRHAGQRRGRVLVDDQDVATTPLHRLAQTIGLVQQNPDAHFATLTVSDEIAFGMENRCQEQEEIRRRSAEAMSLLAVSRLSDRRVSTLSGGEKQRVAVASIVAGQPRALVLDEPSASLDPQASRALFRSLADLCRRTGLTVVIIEHKLAHLLPLSPRLVRLERGRVSESRQLSAVGFQPALTSRVNRPVGLTLIANPDSEHAESGAAALGTIPAARGGTLPSNAPTLEPLNSPLVEMSHLTVELEGCSILDNVSLRVLAGEVVAVMGPNGGGKSTLLHCLLGLVRSTHGNLRVCGADVSQIPVSRLARQIGLVFQNADHQLVADTVWGETLFAARNYGIPAATAEREAARLIEQAGLAERKGDHPYRLSWGQKRRLNLISAILHRPQLLLLDEPFAGQDYENVGFLLDVIRGVLGPQPIRECSGPFDGRTQHRIAFELEGGRSEARSTKTALDASPGAAVVDSTLDHRRACLMVTHDPRIVLRSCTRLVFVSEGQIVVDAPVPRAFDRLRELGHDAYLAPAGVDRGLA